MKIGLTLPNRGVLFGAVTAEQMLEMAEIADRSGAFQSVWVGDSLFGKPRMESITLLAGLAGRTKRLRLVPACMAIEFRIKIWNRLVSLALHSTKHSPDLYPDIYSFTLRDPVQLAYQWASLDLLAGGRTVMVGCTGIVPQAGYDVEAAVYKVGNKECVERLSEWITILKRLWTEDDVTFEGKHYRFAGVTIEPKPAAKPRPPIWIANNARGSRETIERTHRRVARHADGWQTSISDPADVAWRIEDVCAKARELGRDPGEIETHLYHNINVNEDRTAALKESKEFLDIYYTQDTPVDRVESWTAAGSPQECVEHLRVYERMGFDEVTVRVTSWDQLGQLRRVIDEVLPHFR